MSRRCYSCGAIASSKRACKKCGSNSPMVHCHDRDHQSHVINPFRGHSQGLFSKWRGYVDGVEGPATEKCEHVHPYDNYVHLDEPHHEVPA